MPRLIDHLVLPVSSLVIARARLERLGFTVAPDAVHPFGTQNACVFLADGTYLEPLSVADPVKAAEAAAQGNEFTRRDRIFRDAVGEDGFSALVVSSQDAVADRARFAPAGIDGGDLLEFSRGARTADGRDVVASFRLAFAETASKAFFLFACERLNPLPADRAHLERHANAVLGLRGLLLVAERPKAVQAVLETIMDAAARPAERGFRIEAQNGFVSVEQPRAVEVHLGSAAAYVAGTTEVAEPLQGAALIFATGDLAVTAQWLADKDVAFEKSGTRIVVAAAPGQGAAFVFEE
ncbi:VOC family protein [Rhizobium sp. SGZ-381]|uniref:VOC family protein n=1 Tax=Rhizobium sp. SGZ-381 TaxID=3342800 RepID=UPI003670B2D2